MPTPGRGSIGGLDYSPEERHRLANKSRDWKCDTCGHAATLVLPVGAAERSDQEQKEMEDIEPEINQDNLAQVADLGMGMAC